MLISHSYSNATPTTERYTLSLHDALPISRRGEQREAEPVHAPALERARRARRQDRPLRQALAQRLERLAGRRREVRGRRRGGDRKSTRLNSSHVEISYAVFCLKKKRTQYG